jgi:glycerol-3-phosphate dehydrogenase
LPLTPDVTRAAGAKLLTGYKLGDALRRAAGTSPRALPRSRRARAVEARSLAPALRRDGMRHAILAWDAQLEDDARLVVAIARTAAAHGALVVTRCGVTAVERGVVHARDELTGERLEIAARHVVNATGVWAGELDPAVAVRPSKGAHVVVRAQRLGWPRAAVSVPADERGRRFVFGVPLPDGLVAIGLTDDPFDGPIPDEPPVEPAEERFLLETFSRALEAPLTHDDVVGRFAGLRPLVDAPGATSDLSRRHAVIESPDRAMLTIVGGKLTTYRRMAQDVVDRIVARPGMTAGPCVTRRLALVGASRSPQSDAASPRLVRRFGAEAGAVAALAGEHPHLLEPVAEGVGVLGVELVFAARSELALTVDDLLDRRTRLGLVPADRAAAFDGASAALDLAQGVAA